MFLARTPFAVPLLVLAVGCADASSDGDDTDTDVDCTPGALDLTWAPDTTGYRESTITYDVPWSGEAREIGFHLWYPTDATEGETAAYLGVFADPHALIDAPFADPAPGCRLPLVVYSHGSQAWGGGAATLLRHLAAQGWVVAAPDHTTNTVFDNVEPRPRSFSLTRVEDVRRTVDAVAALPEGHPLRDRVDTDHVLVVGHSFGGQTAWLAAGPDYDDAAIAGCVDDTAPCTRAERDAFTAAERDPRVVAVMPLDGGAGEDLVAASGWDGVDVPIFAQSQANEGSASMFERASGAADVTWVSIAGSCHESFTGNPIACDGLEKEEGLGIVGTYLYAFAAKTVLGDTSAEVAAILDGNTVMSDRVTLQSTR